MNIILIGFRGTGKTTIGKMLSQRLGMEFIDADEYLEGKKGKSIKDIFSEGGEKLFREIEMQVIAELCLCNDRVIATGGGVVLREENIRQLRRCGVIVLLEAGADTIYKRIRGDGTSQQRRPGLTDRGEYQEIEYLLEFRKPLYDKVADFVLDTTRVSPGDAANKIITFLRAHALGFKKSNQKERS